MNLLKTLFNPELKEQFEIKGIRVPEFTKQLQARVDETPKDFLSRSENEFYGKVGKDSFKLSVNKLLKLGDTTFYGKYYSLQGKLILEVRFSPSANQRKAPIVIAGLGVISAAALFTSGAINWGYSLLILLVGFGIAAISSHISRVNEMEEFIKLLRRVFSNKEISMIKSTLRIRG